MSLDAYKFPPDRETYFLPRGGTEGHVPTCPRSQYPQAGRLGEKCGCAPADPLVEAIRASIDAKRRPRDGSVCTWPDCVTAPAFRVRFSGEVDYACPAHLGPILSISLPIFEVSQAAVEALRESIRRGGGA